MGTVCARGKNDAEDFSDAKTFFSRPAQRRRLIEEMVN